MKDTNLAGLPRTEDFGSAGSRRVLASGRIPAVIYGKEKPVHITLEANEFQNKLRYISESTLVTLKVGRKNHQVLVKDFQENYLKGTVTHVDFFEVTKGEVLRTRVPIVLEGNPEGAKFGGVLEQVSFDIEIEALPKDLPRNITVDVSALGLNESINVSELELPEGVKPLSHADTTIASVKGVREEVEADEEGVEVEVIDRGAADEEEATNEE
jgi:large subunit ribosomal protein L25